MTALFGPDWARSLSIAVAAALAGLAAFGLVGGPSRGLGRATAGAGPPAAAGRSEARVGGPGNPKRLRGAGSGWHRAGADAAAPRVRLALGVGIGLSATVFVTAVSSLPAPLVFASGVMVAAGAYLGAGKLEAPAARRRRHRMVIELPQVLELIAACLRVGLPLRAAAREVAAVIEGPLAEDLGLVVRQIELGVAEADAWRSLRGHPVLGRLAVDLARSTESGTMIGQTLRQHARDARRRRRGALEARAKTVGVHSVPPLMVCFLPAFLLIGVVPTGVSAFLHALG